MKSEPRWVFPLILVTVPTAALSTLMLKSHSTYVLPSLEFIAEAAILSILLSRRRTEARNFWTFAVAASALFFADTSYSLRAFGFLPTTQTNPAYTIINSTYTVFMVAALLTFVQALGGLSSFIRKWPWHVALFTGAMFLNIRFTLLPSWHHTTSSIALTNSLIYDVASSLLLGAVLPYAIRTTERYSHWMLQLVIMFLIADFGVRYQASLQHITYFSWAEPGWCTAVVGFAWLTYFDRKHLSFLDLRGKFAPLISIRALLTLAICGANILFMLASLWFGIQGLKSGNDLGAILFLLYLFWFVANEFSLWLAHDLQQILPDMFQSTKHLSADGTLNLRLEKVHTKTSIFEIKQVLESYNGLVERENKLSDLSRQMVRDKALVEIASQVSHDIRSPLSALNMVLDTAKELGEQKRVLMSSALARINDISNDLLQRYKAIQTLSTKEPHLLALEVEQIVSEKRLQFGYRHTIGVRYDVGPGLRNVFVELDPKDFKRVISNLINNCYEAFFDGAGDRIDVRLESSGDRHVKISVRDNGPGIPAEVMARLETGDAITTKESGCGLGLRHARRIIEALGGELTMHSSPGGGTAVEIMLLKAPVPEWFCERLKFAPGTQIVVLDDDISVHGVWRQRMTGAREIQLIGFDDGAEMKAWYRENAATRPRMAFLVDYELLRQPQTGLDIIEELGIAGGTTLVTSRYDDLRVRQRCIRLGIKILPKALIESTPLILELTPQRDAPHLHH